MENVNKKGMFLFLLISSIGSWIFWLALGPYIYINLNGSSDLGIVGLVRQLSIFLGVIIGTASLVPENDLKQSIFVEILTVIVGITFYIYLGTANSAIFLFTLAGVRFLLSGSSFIYTFSSFTKSLENQGNGIIFHLLSTQGAVVFASIIGALLLDSSLNSLKLAVVADVVSSAALVLLMLRSLRKGGGGLTAPKFKSFCFRVVANVHRSISSIWIKENKPWSVYYVLVMFLISGLAVYGNKIGNTLTGGLKLQGFSSAILLYGIALWLTGFWLIRKKDFTVKDLFIGVLFGLSAGVFNIFEVYQIAYVCYLIAFGILLNGLNKKILMVTPDGMAGYVRGSLGFYLTTVFASMELFYGKYLLLEHGLSGIGYVQVFVSILIIILIGFYNVSKKRMD